MNAIHKNYHPASKFVAVFIIDIRNKHSVKPQSINLTKC